MTENMQEPVTSQPTPPVPVITREEKMWGTICHLAGLALFIYPVFGNVIATLIVWLIKKDVSGFVRDQGREALNFQISISIYLLIALVLSFILIGIPLFLIILIFDIIMIITAAGKVSEGERFIYPMTFRFIK